MLRKLMFTIAVFLTAQHASAATPDATVACVQQQLTGLGYGGLKATGKVDAATRAAAKAFKSKSSAGAIRALPVFKLETAVGWCREIAAAHPKTRKHMPSAQSPIVLAHGGAKSVPHTMVARAFAETEGFFRRQYGFQSASRVDVAGSHDIRELAGFTAELQRKRRFSSGGIAKGLNKACNQGHSYGGVAYRNQLLVCWPKPKSLDRKWQRKTSAIVTGIMVHEYMHHAQRELTNDKFFASRNYYARRKMGPAWMVEGTAEVVQFDWLVRRGGIKDPGVGGLITRASKSTKTLRSMHDYGSVKGGRQYTVAHLAAQLLAERHGERAMFTYWRQIGRGHNWEAAFQAAFKMRLSDYERLFETLRRDPAKATAFARGG